MGWLLSRGIVRRSIGLLSLLLPLHCYPLLFSSFFLDCTSNYLRHILLSVLAVHPFWLWTISMACYGEIITCQVQHPFVLLALPDMLTGSLPTESVATMPIVTT